MITGTVLITFKYKKLLKHALYSMDVTWAHGPSANCTVHSLNNDDSLLVKMI